MPEKHRPAGWIDPLRQQQPLVSAGWLLKALGIAVALAALCVYAALCVLFYQGQWQMVFHPSRTITTTPASAGMRYDNVPFDVTETGAARLDGWWIPADASGPGPGQTILFLHDGRGSLSDTVAQLQTLHALGVNLFAFDYRGFGRSANTRPSERSMDRDADAAWAYLTDTRHLPPSSIVLYGAGLGADIAAHTASRHSMAAAVVLDTPGLPALTLVRQDPRSRMLPVRLLLTSSFKPEKTLTTLGMPKLFLNRAPPNSAMADWGQALFHAAAPPKEIHNGSSYTGVLHPFLNKYAKQ